MLTQQPRDSPPTFVVTNGEGGAIGIPPEFVSNASSDGRRNCLEICLPSDEREARLAGNCLGPFSCYLPQARGTVSAVSTVLPRHLGMVAGATRDSGIASRAGFEFQVNVSPKRSGQSTMTEHPRISLAPDVLVGKPIIRGTRLSVELVIGLMADDGARPISSGITRGLPTTTSSRVFMARYVELGEGIPSASSRAIISLARRSPFLRQPGTTSFGSG
jgi:Protein of unknown function (DUF433)